MNLLGVVVNLFKFSSVVFLISLVLSTGCGDGRPSADDMLAKSNQENIQRLATLYVRFQLSNGSAGPANEAEFRKFISDCSPKRLERIGVDINSIDDLFISERDSEPFKIRYGVRGNSRGSNDPIVFEAVGADGKRRVGFTSLKVVETENDKEYQELLGQ